MSFAERIGIDVGKRARIEDGIQTAIQNGIKYLDLKIDIAPNNVESLDDARVAGIRRLCDDNGIKIGIHTMSAVNIAEVAPHVRDGVDRYIFGHMDACKRLGGEWLVVHAGYHFTSDFEMRRDAGLDRLLRMSAYAEKIGIDLRLENMNKEPADAEVKYLGYNLEETQWYFERLTSPRLRWAFTANHAHLVPEGIPAFIDGLDISRCDEVRLADCWRNGKEIHLRPGEGDLDFGDLFRRLDRAGFKGHYINAFGSLQDVIDGRVTLGKIGDSVL
jgi:sugar phosphate isomerase/epimerase